jgi:hypothetical protein
VLAERALEAVIADIAAHTFAITSWRFFFVGLRLFHFKTCAAFATHGAQS